MCMMAMQTVFALQLLHVPGIMLRLLTLWRMEQLHGHPKQARGTRYCKPKHNATCRCLERSRWRPFVHGHGKHSLTLVQHALSPCVPPPACAVCNFGVSPITQQLAVNRFPRCQQQNDHPPHCHIHASGLFCLLTRRLYFILMFQYYLYEMLSTALKMGTVLKTDMVVHHIASMCLIALAYHINLVRFGTMWQALFDLRCRYRARETNARGRGSYPGARPRYVGCRRSINQPCPHRDHLASTL
jgi:hypothetical protein